jgi:hypothetical protein
MTITVEEQCVVCKEVSFLDVSKNDWLAWRRGTALVQHAFPYLSAGQRELLVSGVCGKCFDDMFGDEG